MIDFQSIKAAVSFEAVLDHYGIVVGRNHKVLCPFHDDSDPSMQVYRDGFYCFTCGAGGDAINFVARKEGISNLEAAKVVAEIGGLTVPDDYHTRRRIQRSASAKEQQTRRKKALKATYDEKCMELRRLKRLADELQPNDPDAPFCEEWCEAVKRIPALEDMLDGIYRELDKLR